MPLIKVLLSPCDSRNQPTGALQTHAKYSRHILRWALFKNNIRRVSSQFRGHNKRFVYRYLEVPWYTSPSTLPAKAGKNKTNVFLDRRQLVFFVVFPRARKQDDRQKNTQNTLKHGRQLSHPRGLNSSLNCTLIAKMRKWRDAVVWRTACRSPSLASLVYCLRASCRSSS